MSRAVYKYELLPGAMRLDLPRGAELLHAGTQGRTAYLWALVDPDEPEASRMVFAQATGEPMPRAAVNADYVDTFTLSSSSGPLVFHVFDGGEWL